MNNRKYLFLIIILLSTFNISFAQKEIKMFRDTLDNALDFSNFLINNNGVLPIVVPITEPAVGYGAVVGALYFVQKKGENERDDIAVVAGGLTSNNTWLALGAYLGFWNQDKIRYRGIFGYAEANLKYYGFVNSQPIDFSLNSFVFIQQALFRIKESNFFLGGKYQLAKINIPLFENDNVPIDPRDFNIWNSGLSLITEFDNLNSLFSPTKGHKFHLEYVQNLEALGSTKNWGNLNFYAHMYFPVNDKWIPAFKFESQLATGDVPFYAKPFVSLRGVPALRYQGDFTILTETEQLYNVSYRWGVLGFAGIGAAFDDSKEINTEEFVWNLGVGTRYLMARAYGLKMGVDIARGPEEWAFYITIGSAWMK